MDIDRLLQVVVEQDASDCFLTAGAAPSIKVHGHIRAVSREALDAKEVRKVILATMTSEQREQFEDSHECNYALVHPRWGRFRASAFFQRGLCGLVLRRIKTDIPTFEELGLPPVLADLSMVKRGLVIFVGATGTGKSSSLAAMIGHRNRNSSSHIVCIEDPIEFLHEHDQSLITQREVGLDTDSFEVALRNTLRQAPDVIMIGEVRTPEAMAQAITFAETGHLCLCTLHANNANQALDRIQSFFPSERLNQVWMDLSLNLKGMVAQQLVPNVNGDGRVPVVEILLNTPLVADHIRNGEVHLLKELMSRSTEHGMQTMDQSLLARYKSGDITAEEALRHADSKNDLRLLIKMHDHGGVDAPQALTYERGDDRGKHMR